MTKEIKSSFQSSRLEGTGSSSLENKWLSNDDVCFVLRISKRTLQNYRDNGILPFAQIRRKIYYRPSDIEAYLEAHYIKSNDMKGLVA
jgi:protein tyrosine phosphatase